MNEQLINEMECLRAQLKKLSNCVDELPQTRQQSEFLSKIFAELQMNLTRLEQIGEDNYQRESSCEKQLSALDDSQSNLDEEAIFRHFDCSSENVNQNQQVEATLEYRVAFERLLTQISTQFINLTCQEIEQGINGALKAIGEFTSVDRVYIYSSDGKQIALTHEWHGKTFVSASNIQQEIPSDSFLWIAPQLRQFKTVYIPVVDELPAVAEAEKEVLQILGIKTFVAVPLVYDSVLIGTLCFSSINKTKVWSKEDLTLLSTLGDIFANALARKYVENTLKENEERFRQLVDNIDEVFWLYCLENNRVIYISPAYETIWGISPKELYENACSWIETIHPDDRNNVLVSFENGLIGEQINTEYRIVRPDGEIRWIRLRAFPICNEQGIVYRYAGISEDISEQKLAFEQLQASLRDKEVLFQEIHHRVKNNLQIISSLLYLQVNRLKDQQARDFLQDSRNRIESMALVHESLYRKHNFAGVNFAEYVQSIAANLFDLYKSISSNISLKVVVDSGLLIDLNQAVPCGLIINELITNALKYGFKNTSKGEVFITLKNLNQQFILIVGNNGDDLPADFELEDTQSMGLRLVTTLVRQLQGNINLERNGLIAFKITFPNL